MHNSLKRAFQPTSVLEGSMVKSQASGGLKALFRRLVAGESPKESASKVEREKERARRAMAAQTMHENRMLIGKVVKDSLLVAEMLSGSYKFKVLSHGLEENRFSVLLDISQPPRGGEEQQLESEIMIANLARNRYGLEVVSVYWRMSKSALMKRPAAPVPRPADALLGQTDYADLS